MRLSTPRMTCAVVLSTTLALAGCGSDSNDDAPATPPPAPLTTIPVTAQARGFTTLVTAVTAADLGPTLSSTGPFTVFAPTNTAFAGLGTTLDTLLQPAQKTTLQGILTYHVLNGRVDSTAATSVALGSGTATTVQGASIIVDRVGTSLYVNEAKVITTNVAASNGIIHAIDKVITPPKSIVDTLTERGFSRLVGAVGTAGLASILSGPGPFTVFAPTDAAFERINATVAGLTPTQLANVLSFHVVNGKVRASQAVAAATAGTAVTTLLSGSTLTFSAGTGGALQIVSGADRLATITSFNIPATNGVIHVIDTVLIPVSGVGRIDRQDEPTTN